MLDFRQSKIEDLGVAALRDKNVCWLDVAMNNAARVSGIQGVRNFDGEGQKGLRRQRVPRDHVLQGHAIQVLHDDECLAILLSDFIDRADVWMIQSGSGLRFALKPSQRQRILRELFGQELQRDEAVKRGVFSLVDHTHPTAA